MRKLVAVVCAFFLPPVGVLLGGGELGDLLINIILTLFFWVPGVLHALWVILTAKE